MRDTDPGGNFRQYINVSFYHPQSGFVHFHLIGTLIAVVKTIFHHWFFCTVYTAVPGTIKFESPIIAWHTIIMEGDIVQLKYFAFYHDAAHGYDRICSKYVVKNISLCNFQLQNLVLKISERNYFRIYQHCIRMIGKTLS